VLSEEKFKDYSASILY